MNARDKEKKCLIKMNSCWGEMEGEKERKKIGKIVVCKIM